MADIVERLRFDAIRSEVQFSKGVASNIDEAANEIERLRNLVEGLRTAFEPFVALRDQSPCEMAKVIHKGLDGVTPISLTVTKDQFKAACSAFSSTERTGGAA
jgi:hypothetical protein